MPNQPFCGLCRSRHWSRDPCFEICWNCGATHPNACKKPCWNCKGDHPSRGQPGLPCPHMIKWPRRDKRVQDHWGLVPYKLYDWDATTNSPIEAGIHQQAKREFDAAHTANLSGLLSAPSLNEDPTTTLQSPLETPRYSPPPSSSPRPRPRQARKSQDVGPYSTVNITSWETYQHGVKRPRLDEDEDEEDGHDTPDRKMQRRRQHPQASAQLKELDTKFQEEKERNARLLEQLQQPLRPDVPALSLKTQVDDFKGKQPVRPTTTQPQAPGGRFRKPIKAREFLQSPPPAPLTPATKPPGDETTTNTSPPKGPSEWDAVGARVISVGASKIPVAVLLKDPGIIDRMAKARLNSTGQGQDTKPS